MVLASWLCVSPFPLIFGVQSVLSPSWDPRQFQTAATGGKQQRIPGFDTEPTTDRCRDNDLPLRANSLVIQLERSAARRGCGAPSSFYCRCMGSGVGSGQGAEWACRGFDPQQVAAVWRPRRGAACGRRPAGRRASGPAQGCSPCRARGADNRRYRPLFGTIGVVVPIEARRAW